MITLRISNWPVIEGLGHTSTTWQISDKTDFVLLLDEVVESNEFLNVYRTNIVVPIGKEYYARAKRFFSNGSSGEWIGPIKIISNESGDNVDIKPFVIIEEPSVRLEIDEINNLIKIKSGSFRCDVDGHKSTCWVLKDSLNRVLYRNMYDTVNKREITIDSTNIINNTNKLIAEVCYVSTNDFESHFGKYIMELNKFNFEITSNLNSVPINEDLEIKFKPYSGHLHKLIKYKIHTDENELISGGILNDNSDNIIVSRSLLRSNTSYILKLYSSELPDDVNKTIFYTSSNETTYRIDRKFKYTASYIDTKITLSNLRSIVSEQLVDNSLPFINRGTNRLTLMDYRRDLNNIVESNVSQGFLNDIPYLNNDGLVVKVINNSKILINYINNDNKREFIVYDYNYKKVISSIVREDEALVNTFNIEKNFTIGLNEKVYYFTKVDDVVKFRCYDILTNTITDLTDRPDIDRLDVNVAYIGNDRILSFNGSLNKRLAYLYDISDNVWYDVNVVPERYTNLNLISLVRKDGKVASFNVSDDTNDVLVFDPKDNTFEIEVNDLDDTIDLDSVVRLRNGDFLRFSTKTEQSRIYIYR